MATDNIDTVIYAIENSDVKFLTKFLALVIKLLNK